MEFGWTGWKTNRKATTVETQNTTQNTRDNTPPLEITPLKLMNRASLSREPREYDCSLNRYLNFPITDGSGVTLVALIKRLLSHFGNQFHSFFYFLHKTLAMTNSELKHHWNVKDLEGLFMSRLFDIWIPRVVQKKKMVRSVKLRVVRCHGNAPWAAGER